MPWKDMSLVQQRKQFIDEYLRKEHSVSELSRKFGVSRKTAYKWISRFLSGCELTDRSRKPLSSPSRTSEELREALIAWRAAHPTWGPKKLRAALARMYPKVELPSVSTIAYIFKRGGLITPRRRRNRTPPSTTPLGHANEPNALWCIDFKGDFTVGTRRCYPLTVTDAYSRYLLAVVALRNTRTDGVRKALEQIFTTFGLPRAIRSDNGSPFASKAPAGLSELSTWWLKLGIRHERIEPGKPQQNGRHERMHLTLKNEATMPAATSLRAQQRRFDLFRQEFNELRPHEALGQNPPCDFYERSPRPLPQPPWGRDFTYPEDFETSRVRRNGAMIFNDRSTFVSTVLKHELLGLDWQDDGSWVVHFGPLVLGSLSGKQNRLSKVLPMSSDNPSPMSSE